MHRLLAALCLVGLISSASADEFDNPVLRGSNPFVPAVPTYTNWSGFYVGGQVGYGSANVDFSGSTQSLFALMLQQLAFENTANVNPPVSQWSVLGKADSQATTYGGFFGYNSQWDNLILGVDVNISHTSFFATAPSLPINRVVSAGGNTYDVTLSGNATMRIQDMATVRGRAGYIMNNFMPYVTFGFAAGRADITRTANAFVVQNPPSPFDLSICGTAAAPTCATLSQSLSELKNGAFIYGWALGGGLDVLVFQNIFARIEYEYLSFGSVAGIKPSINTGRVGLAYKF